MSEYPKTLVLPGSGRTVTIERRLKGKDIRMSERLAGRKADATQRSFAMLAQVVLLDGQPVMMEDLDEWDLDDINEVFRGLGLAAEDDDAGEKKSQMQPVSPPSSNGGSRPLS